MGGGANPRGRVPPFGFVVVGGPPPPAEGLVFGHTTTATHDIEYTPHPHPLPPPLPALEKLGHCYIMLATTLTLDISPFVSLILPPNVAYIPDESDLRSVRYAYTSREQ